MTVPDRALDSESRQERPSSTIVRTEILGRTVYAKQYVAGDWGRTSAVVRRRTLREMKLVQRLHGSGQFRRELGAMQIIEGEPERGTLVTREIPGDTFEVLIDTRFRNVDFECRRAMFLAGRWLRVFQQVKLPEDELEPISDLDPQDLVEYCGVRLRTLEDYGYYQIDARSYRDILDRLDHLLTSAPESDHQLVWSHADYAPGNIIWGDGTLTPIDFGMAQADRPLQDVTYFVNRLEMLRVYRPWKRFPVEAWTRAFLRGYGRPDAQQSPMYQALMIRHMICRLHSLVRRPPRNLQQRVHDTWVRNQVRRQLARLADRPGA